MKKLLLMAAVVVAVAACSKKSRNRLGISETIPDEYQVQRYKSLEVPPHFIIENSDTHKNKK